MERKQFLRRLSGRLYWFCPKKEAQEILADYGECFDEGVAEGKSEAALCKEFGAPEDIVRALCKENASWRKLTLWKALGWICIAGPLLLGFLYCSNWSLGSRLPQQVWWKLLLVTVPPLILYFLLGGMETADGAQKRWHVGAYKGLTALCCFLYIHAVGAISSTVWLLLQLLSGGKLESGMWPWLWLMPLDIPESCGPYMATLIGSAITAISTATLIELFVGKESLWICPVMFVNFGLITTVKAYILILGNMSDPSTIPTVLLKGAIPLFFGLVLAVGSAYVLYKRSHHKTGGPGAGGAKGHKGARIAGMVF